MLKTLLINLLVGLLLVNAQTTNNSEEFFEEDEWDKLVDEKTKDQTSSSVYQTVNHVVIEMHKNNSVVLVHISDPLIIIEDGNGENLSIF